jgi:hypothetical protein
VQARNWSILFRRMPFLGNSASCFWICLIVAAISSCRPSKYSSLSCRALLSVLSLPAGY